MKYMPQNKECSPELHWKHLKKTIKRIFGSLGKNRKEGGEKDENSKVGENSTK